MPDKMDPIQKEIRFSVVMYGGVSLAIYINGVSQEIFKLVRATARKKYHAIAEPDNNEYLLSDEELSGSERVYRALGKLLKASFVVDILAGTSAGGINAVYLAKALANDQPFQPLKDLWIQQGDINLLINDKDSLADLAGLSAQPDTASLLNSQRMYYKLLAALDSMDGLPIPENQASLNGGPFKKSPYVGELDLFVTATDLHGLPLPLPLPAGSHPILEKEYRAVFRFHYSTQASAGKDSNDFLQQENPFLAFAARCTSSFPLAFEPMCFSDTERVLNTPEFKQRYSYQPKIWKRFYKDYAHAAFPDLPFGDGGYLDNKPFSYATETLSQRRADVPVERKMIYIEPAPDDIRTKENQARIVRPDPIDNTLAAVYFLPRTETIRDDLKLIAERNATIAQVNKILEHLTPVAMQVLSNNQHYWEAGGRLWAQQFLDYSIQYFGPSYAFYHQLRVDYTVRDLREALARNLSLDESRQPAQRLSESIEIDWRARLYTPLQDGGHRSENDLLFRLDLGYRLRRLQFLQKIINQLMVHTGTTQDSSAEASAIHNLLRVSQVSVNLQDPQQEAAFRGELHRIKAKLNEAYNILRDAGRSLRTRGLCTENYPDLDVPQAYIFQVRKLGELLNASSPDRAAIGDQIEAISLLIFSRNKEQPGYLGEKFSEASAQIEQILGEAVGLKQADLLPAQIDARSVLAYFYKHYEYYDMVTYPILLDAPVGESGIVKVYRISPEDAPGIFDQTTSSRKKLLGTKFANFGAFFDKSWRENDMLWGRLDGAECLINALLPEESEWKTKLRVEAQDAILRDDAIYKKLQERVASKRVASKQAESKQGASNGKNPDFPLPSGGRSELIEAFQEFQMDEAYLPERIQRLAVRVAPVLSLVLKSMLSRRQYLRLFVVWIPPAARLYNAILKVRAFLHLPWKLRKPAQAK